MRKKVTPILLLNLVLFLSIFAQKTTETLRHFDSSQIKEWKNDRNFQYRKNLLPELTWWDRLKMWLWQKWREMMSTDGGVTTFWSIVVTLSIIIIVVLVYKYKGKTTGLWSKSNKDDLNFQSLQEENIHEINFEEKIAQALDARNYRLAIRLRYLYILKILDDREKIKWQAGKTNSDYVLEVRKNTNEDIYSLFKQISLAFDFAWYGERDANLENYEKVKGIFDQLKNNSFTTKKVLVDERI